MVFFIIFMIRVEVQSGDLECRVGLRVRLGVRREFRWDECLVRLEWDLTGNLVVLEHFTIALVIVTVPIMLF